MLVDFIIVGSGIAGSCIALELVGRGAKVALFGARLEGEACPVAAGVINPITGKRLVKSWRSDTAHPFAKNFYKELENKLSSHFFHERKILQICISGEERQLWRERSSLPDYAKLVGEELPAGALNGFSDPFGSRFIENSAWVEPPLLMGALGNFFDSASILRREVFSFDRLRFSCGGGTFSYGDLSSGGIIFAEGWRAVKNPFFNWLPYRPAKGEILTLRTGGFDLPEHIIHKGKWLMRDPFDAKVFRTGSTWDRENLDAVSSSAARAEILSSLDRVFSPRGRLEVLRSESGIRPCTATTRPHIGSHPEISGMYSFNGFGSKGFALSPFFASHFADFLLDGSELDAEADIRRHVRKFFAKGKQEKSFSQ